MDLKKIAALIDDALKNGLSVPVPMETFMQALYTDERGVCSYSLEKNNRNENVLWLLCGTTKLELCKKSGRTIETLETLLTNELGPGYTLDQLIGRGLVIDDDGGDGGASSDSDTHTPTKNGIAEALGDAPPEENEDDDQDDAPARPRPRG